MVESICGQGFAYTHEVEEDWAKELVKLGQKTTEERLPAAETKTIFRHHKPRPRQPFYRRSISLFAWSAR
jgi:hypothetical protein